MKIIDITPELNKNMAVWPGDLPFSYEKDISGDMTIGKIITSVHSGAHIDAPLHISPSGKSLSELSLEPFVGRCQVVDVSSIEKEYITINDIKEELQTPRLLFRTDSFDYNKRFVKNYRAFCVELIDNLAEKNIMLLGIDTPSVDLFNAQGLPVHHRMLFHKIAILEGISLNGVQSGIYTLIALPLKISGSDGSPVRSVLIKE